MAYVAPSLRASGRSFAQLQAGGLIGHLEALLAAQAALGAPGSAPTISASGGGSSGGALAPGTYYAKATRFNGVGETTPSAESSSFSVARQANPTIAATVAVTGGGASGGLLGAGVYFVAYAFVDASGTTTLGTSESASFTVGATNIPRVTLPALPAWAVSISLYLTAVGGATGTETLQATGITTTTYDLAVDYVAGAAKPAANTTSTNIPRVTLGALSTGEISHRLYLTPADGASGSETLYAADIVTTTTDCAAAHTGTVTPPAADATTPSVAETDLVRLGESGRLQKLFDDAHQALAEWLAGDPIATADIVRKLLECAVALRVLMTTVDEVSTLVVANPGILGVASGTATRPATQARTWP